MTRARLSPALPAGDARLELQNVTAAYNGVLALDDLSFEVPYGAQVAVVGPNGAGKSTLFKAMVGLLPLKSGRILIHDLPLGHHRHCVAYVPQREEVDWRFPMTVWDVVMMGRFTHTGWLRRPSAADAGIVRRSLQQMGIADLTNRAIGSLSGGQQQRVFLARALAQEPHILLMDEPFSGIDAPTREATLTVLDQLRQNKITVLISTHDLNLAAQRFEHILLFNRRLVAFGPPRQVFQAALIRQAFASHALILDGMLVIDEYCPDEQPEGRAH